MGRRRGYATSATATHTSDAARTASDIHRNSNSGRVSRSALLPPRAVAGFHAVANTATARIRPLTATRLTDTDRTSGEAEYRAGTARARAASPAVHAIT